MGKKTKIIIIVVAVIIVGIVVLYFAGRGGITPKSQFEKCYEVCIDLMFTEAGRQACDDQCAEDTGYDPTTAEVTELRDEWEESKMNTNSSNTNTTTNTVKNTNSTVNANININSPSNTNAVMTEADYQELEYYCEWSWPQKIIDKNTEEVITRCTSDQPYCNKADGSYEKVGCCEESDYLDCTLLSDLLDF